MPRHAHRLLVRCIVAAGLVCAVGAMSPAAAQQPPIRTYPSEPPPYDGYTPREAAPPETYGRDREYEPPPPAYRPPPGYRPPVDQAEPYPPRREPYDEPPRTYGRYQPPPYPAEPAPPYRRDRGEYTMAEIRDAGHGFFGSISRGLASVIEYAFKRRGRPNGYILGEEAGGAFVAGLRYGEGRLYTKDAGVRRVFWQGPSVGYDFGGAGSKTMILVYNLSHPGELFQRFGGVDGSAYLVGGVGITFLAQDRVVMAPIRSGIGLRLGANIGYLKFTRRPTWNPF
ncbi:MAG: DUF1134 domain-containing protein [Hyphomicrobiaceae bacterium]